MEEFKKIFDNAAKEAVMLHYKELFDNKTSFIKQIC
jgi:hypothetical protein